MLYKSLHRARFFITLKKDPTGENIPSKLNSPEELEVWVLEPQMMLYNSHILIDGTSTYIVQIGSIGFVIACLVKKGKPSRSSKSVQQVYTGSEPCMLISE